MFSFLKWFYINLGNSKSQRFRRFFMILMLGAAVIYFRPEIVSIFSHASEVVLP